MQKDDYESLSYRIQFLRAVRTGVVTLIICLLVIAPTFSIWQMSVARRQVLREAKNVVLNMNLLAAEFLASGEPVRDVGRISGLTERAENMVKSHSAADGEIRLVSWDMEEKYVAALSYQKGRYLVEYQYDESEDIKTWNVYMRIRHYQNSGE